MIFKLKAFGIRAIGKLNLLRNKIYVRSSTLYGRQWRIPLIDSMGYDLAVGEESELWLSKEFQKIYAQFPFSVFIDIGVNIGQTLLKVKSLDPGIRYIGFEPNPICVYYTEYLIRLNSIKNTSINCFGLGAVTALAHLHFLGIEDTRATLNRTETSPSDLNNQRQVAVWALDDINLEISQEERVVVKVDVEGFELEVLTGARNFIQMHRPILFFEALPHQGNDKNIQRSKLLFNLLRDHQYNILLLNQDGSKEAMDEHFDNREDFSRTDFIAFPN
jgi:FkbM family methyltransferase